MATPPNIIAPPPVEQQTGTRSEIVASRSAFWDWLRDLRENLVSIVNFTNSVKNTVATNLSTTLNYLNLSTNAKNEAIGAKDEAINAKNAIESYVIPTDATYSISEIEESLDSALTISIENAYQISIIEGEN